MKPLYWFWTLSFGILKYQPFITYRIQYFLQGAIEEMDQRVCQAEKDLNLMRYQREMKQQELERLKWELDHLNDIQQVSQEDIQTEEVETKLDH